MTETELPVSDMVAVYRKIRAAIDEKEEQHKPEASADSRLSCLLSNLH